MLGRPLRPHPNPKQPQTCPMPAPRAGAPGEAGARGLTYWNGPQGEAQRTTTKQFHMLGSAN